MRKKQALALALAMLLILTACTQQTQKKETEYDIITQVATPEGKTQVSVLVKYAFSVDTFEKAAEEALPNIDIVQVGNYTSDRGIAGYERMIRNNDLTDVVMTWPLEVAEEYWADNLMDLSALPETGKYNISILDNISRDGKLYYLPGPSQIRGIVYNKTLFAEKGWSVPTNFEEFTQLCKNIQASGIRALQLGFGNSEVLDTAFVGYGYEACYSKPADAQWLSEYNGGSGSFGEQFGPALDTFQSFIDQGIWRAEDLKVYYQDREQMFFNRKCAMIEDSAQVTKIGRDLYGYDDEFALMPFFNDGPQGDWARLYPVCYIGLNKNLEQKENNEKYDAVMQLIEYISTDEGQQALMGDAGSMYSSLNGVEPPSDPEIKSLVPALSHDRLAIFPTLQNAQTALRKGLAGMLKGELTKEDVIKMVDDENKNPTSAVPIKVLGQATSDFSLIETGNFITDVMREATGTEIALLLDNGKNGRYNSKGLSARLYEGDITHVDVGCLMPDWRKSETTKLRRAKITGENLVNALEHTLLVDDSHGGWFYYFSGIKVEYAPAAEQGNRVRKITDADGRELDMQKEYTVAFVDTTVDEKYFVYSELMGFKIADVVADAISAKKTISPRGDGRFVVCAP